MFLCHEEAKGFEIVCRKQRLLTIFVIITGSRQKLVSLTEHFPSVNEIDRSEMIDEENDEL